MKQYVKSRLIRLINGQLHPIKDELTARLLNTQDLLKDAYERINRLEKQLYVPTVPSNIDVDEHGFMEFSTCSARDLKDPRFLEILNSIKVDFSWHRKLWEWIYVVYTLQKLGKLSDGMRGLGFGVGTEKLSSLFASFGCLITATDAPESISGEWTNEQYAPNLEALFYEEVVDKGSFFRNVSYQNCDMNHISPNLKGFDFCWSSCAMEHLGSLKHGIDFVLHSVNDCLASGGVAVHTTEFNANSNEQTLETGGTVIYRLRDLQDMKSRLEAQGHKVSELRVASDSHVFDFHVDAPPYSHNPHLKLALAGYVTTSFGFYVIKDGLKDMPHL
jgi:hypothetical protein